MKKEKIGGITLIALVVTIVVLIILATISVQVVLGENGLIKRAERSRGIHENASLREEEQLQGAVDKIDSLIPVTAGTPVKKPDGWSSTTGAISDGAGNAIPLPNGYHYVGGSNTENSGLVISDKENDKMDSSGIESGNQFVWIPVEGENENERKANFVRTKFDTSTGKTNGNLSSYYTEPLNFFEDDGDGAEADPWEKTEYQNMYNSVIKYGGFYIGRYEAGVNSTELRTKATDAQDVVVKKGVAPYNYVPWSDSMRSEGSETSPSGAVYLARKKYSGNKEGVVSTLVYGVQWDAMCKYIGPGEKGAAMKGKHKEATETTGNDSVNVARNIYDLAGNCREWTMEANDYIERILRGEDHYAICDRTYDSPSYGSSSPNFSFRIALYVE